MKLDRAMIRYQKEIAALREDINNLRDEVSELMTAIKNQPVEMIEIGEVVIDETPKEKRSKKAKV